jgi:hypothetical protein
MALVGVSILGHLGPIEGGALYEGGSQGLGASMTGAAALAGVGFDLTPHLRLSLLGEAGRHEYTNVGWQLFGKAGSNGSLPYAGGRLGVLYGFGRDVRFTLGAWLFVRDDLARTTDTVTYDAGWFSPDVKSATNQLGEWQSGFVVRLGAELGGS